MRTINKLLYLNVIKLNQRKNYIKIKLKLKKNKFSAELRRDSSSDSELDRLLQKHRHDQQLAAATQQDVAGPAEQQAEAIARPIVAAATEGGKPVVEGEEVEAAKRANEGEFWEPKSPTVNGESGWFNK